MATIVLNKRDVGFAPWRRYVGRRAGSSQHYGNPFSHHPNSLAAVTVGSRELAIIACKEWLQGTAHQDIEPERRRWILAHVHELKDHELVCHCVPLDCHGWLLAQLADGVPLDQLDLMYQGVR